MRFPLVALALLALPVLCAARAPDPGIRFELDRERFELRVHDARDGVDGPRISVALGSPAHPTPRGAFALREVVLNPAWLPGPTARANGARPEPPSKQSPMGVAKIPFGRAYAVHGGALAVLLGKPVSAGCIRTRDADLLRLVAWLESREALQKERTRNGGERWRSFRRPAHLETR